MRFYGTVHSVLRREIYSSFIWSSWRSQSCALTLPLLITACCPGLSLSTFWQNICWLRIKSTSSVLNFFSKASSFMPCSRITNLWLGHWLDGKFLYFWRMCNDRWAKESFCLYSVIQIKYEQCLSMWNDVCEAKELLTISDELHHQNNFSFQASATSSRCKKWTWGQIR